MGVVDKPIARVKVNGRWWKLTRRELNDQADWRDAQGLRYVETWDRRTDNPILVYERG